MRIIGSLFAALCLVLASAGVAGADNYTIDTSHSQVLFKVKHLGIATVTGKFASFNGTFVFDPNKIEAGSASVTIDVASINTNVEDRDNHLRSPDFFEVEKFPEMTFKSTKVQSIKEDKFQLVGDLTIRGVTKPVTLDVELGGLATDPWGNERAAFSAEATIDRTEFGLTWNKVLEAGGLLVSEDVRIILEIEATKAKS